jgi:hypothetical protein
MATIMLAVCAFLAGYIISDTIRSYKNKNRKMAVNQVMKRAAADRRAIHEYYEEKILMLNCAIDEKDLMIKVSEEKVKVLRNVLMAFEVTIPERNMIAFKN